MTRSAAWPLHTPGSTRLQAKCARLYLSPRTVEKHVERVLAETGQPNHTALAAYATEWPATSTTSLRSTRR